MKEKSLFTSEDSVCCEPERLEAVPGPAQPPPSTHPSAPPSILSDPEPSSSSSSSSSHMCSYLKQHGECCDPAPGFDAFI